jgi:uncharacterized protein YhfF
VIFKPDLAEKILCGEKTATRRRISDNPRSPWHESAGSYPAGMEFAIQPGRGKPRCGIAYVTAHYLERLGDMVEVDAVKEGFRPEGPATALAAFDEAWKTINGSYDEYELVHVIEFELISSEAGA